MDDKKTESFSGSYSGRGKIIYAIIAARGGSKRLPRKNIRLLKGKPLIAYSIIAAITCPLIQRCFVTTDDSEIAKISREWGAEIIERPSHLAEDDTPSEDVIHHALEYLNSQGSLPEYFTLLQPTSPLRNSQHLQQSIEMFMNSKACSLVSVTPDFLNTQKVFLKKSNGYLSSLQSYAGFQDNTLTFYRPNGAIYFTSSRLFLEYHSFYLEPILPFIMEREKSVDIDTLFDFTIASLLLEQY